MSETAGGTTGAPRTGSWNDLVVEQFRAGEPVVADQFRREGLLLLHTTGARTGEPRLSPVAHFLLDGRHVVIASAAGRDRHPAWYFNLLANPRVTAEVWVDDGIETFAADARPAEGEERDRLWAAVTERAPGFADYQRRTPRVIPVVVLTRLAG